MKKNAKIILVIFGYLISIPYIIYNIGILFNTGEPMLIILILFYVALFLLSTWGLFRIVHNPSTLPQSQHIDNEKRSLSPAASPVSVGEYDRQWKEESKERAKNLQEGKLGLARNNLFAMASIREKEGALKDSIFLYFEVCYEDLSGFDSLESLRLGREDNFKFFSPTPFFFLCVVKRISIISKKLDLSDSDLRDIFMSADLSHSTPAHIMTQENCASLVIKAIHGEDVEKEIKAAVKLFIRTAKAIK